MPYSARELFDRVNTFLGDNGDTRFKEVLEGLNVGTEYSIDFQDPTDSKKTYPRIYVDILGIRHARTDEQGTSRSPDI